jgi:hypothetical protein
MINLAHHTFPFHCPAIGWPMIGPILQRYARTVNERLISATPGQTDAAPCRFGTALADSITERSVVA